MDIFECITSNNIRIFRRNIITELDLNRRTTYDNTALIVASMGRKLKIVKILIALRVDLNCINKYGNTALMEASSYGHLDVVKTLINAGADMNIKNKIGYTASTITNYNKIANYLKFRQRIKS